MDTDNNNMNGNNEGPTTGLKILVLIGLIILLIVGILLPIKLVPNAVTGVKSFFSSLFGRNDTVELSTSKDQIMSGEAFTLSWNGDVRTDGSYILSYPCRDNVQLETSLSEAHGKIACNTQFFFSPIDNTLELTAYTNQNGVKDIPVTLSFLPNTSSDIKTLADITLSVENPNGTPIAATSTKPVAIVPTPTPTPSTGGEKVTPVAPVKKPTVTRSHKVSNPNGIADLRVTVMNVGYMNAKTTNFVPSSTVQPYQRPAVKFVVRNIGTKNTGAWNFTANIPSKNRSTYSAYNLPNLGPGDAIEYTLGFENINDVRDNYVTITVDPGNYIREISDANNVSQGRIINLQYNGMTPYPTPVYPNPVYQNAQADLTVRVLSARSLAGAFNQYDGAQVQFEVTNTGSRATGAWRFTADLPTVQNGRFTSNYQPSLLPGAKVVLTLNFDQIQNRGTNYVYINVDPTNEVDEVRNDNNSTTASFYRN